MIFMKYFIILYVTLYNYNLYIVSGDLLGFGCKGLGQLLVWEWQSESYVLKQQGHAYNMNCVSYSPDSLSIATGTYMLFNYILFRNNHSF